MLPIDEVTEWLEADGRGGFASGTSLGIRTRRYHALLLTATTPPTGRFVLVNGLDVAVCTPSGEFPLSFQRYVPGVTTQTDRVQIEEFTCDPWPRWAFRLADGSRIIHELCVAKEGAQVVVTWRLAEPRDGITLRVRPLMSGRDYHALHDENTAFRFDPETSLGCVRWRPYPDVPETVARHNGTYTHDPVWYRRFRYDQELARGFDHSEDLASPGILTFDLATDSAVLVLAAGGEAQPGPEPAEKLAARLRATESRRRAGFATPLERAADAYIVERTGGKTILAGYPWFADWGRDTFIAIRGLCLATGRLDDAREVLLGWAGTDSRGVLPNRFPDKGGALEYNSVDASLWFIIAAQELMEAAIAAGRAIPARERDTLQEAIQRILGDYAGGTHHGIRMDEDGLLAAGVPGVQLTWMDARIGARVVTPRIGKPVEVQALWLNALRIGALWAPRWADVLELGLESFKAKFWNQALSCLFDVVDVDHVRGTTDPTIRPNQILAVGGLPMCLLDLQQAERLVSTVESRLLTPLGLRSLEPGHPDYCREYRGGPEQRDSAYHQGTVWPWLMGPFAQAWVRVRGDTAQARLQARDRFLQPLMAHLNQAGLGHVSEVADAEPAHEPGGCPFQAWSVGELLRMDRVILAAAPSGPRPVARLSPRSRRHVSV